MIYMTRTARARYRTRRFATAAAVVLGALTLGTAGVVATVAAEPADEVSLVSDETGTIAEARSPLPGFLLDRGRYTVVEASDPDVQVFPASINNRGVAVGEYVLPDQRESGLLRNARGRITTFDIPGAAGTEATGINDRGQITGAYSEDTPIVNNSARPRGFILDGDRVTTVDYPGAASTEVTAVNSRGQAVGAYTDADGVVHGFRWERGRLTALDVPGAATTVPVDINDRGQILGYTSDAAGTWVRGFVWERGRLTTIQAPDAPFTMPGGINNRGQIVGVTYDDADLTGAQGFLLARGAGSRFIPINVPGAPRTLASDINDRGQIVGLYENPVATAASQELPAVG
jgi:probable HAF family extracellular repeat protein